MDETIYNDPSFYNPAVPDLVYVYDFNGVAGDNFQLFYNNNHPPSATQRARIQGYIQPM